MIKKTLVAIAVALVSLPGLAQQQATPVNGDTRLVTFEYDADQTYLILTRPKAVTHVQLRADERVKLAVAGDTANFNVVVSSDRNHVLIRPKYENQSTSLTLVTNERSYPIMLRSTPEGSGKWYQRVTWNFQDMVLEDIAGQEPAARGARSPAAAGQGEAATAAAPGHKVAIDKMAVDYRIEGDAEFRPTQVFDDGVRTYLRFPDALQNLPAVFAVADGEARIVNFNLDDKFVVIQGVSPTLLLKLGKAEVRIIKGGAKRGFFAGGLGG